MVDLDLNIVLDAALRILLTIDDSISVRFSKDAIHIKLPTTRRLADFLEVPHYYVLPILGMMEMDELITRAERVGIHTTNKGSKIFVALMHERYKNEAERCLDRQYSKRYGGALTSREFSWSDGVKVIIVARSSAVLLVFFYYMSLRANSRKALSA